MIRVITVLLFLIFAPIAGGLLDGLDRKISARMQGRVGPPLLQPFYDVKKLMNKELVVANKAQTFLVLSYAATQIFTGCMFYAGVDVLMCFFVLSTGATFLVFAGFISNSPYSSMGASRELIQMMSYEPAVLLSCVGFYLATGTFGVSEIIQTSYSPILVLPGFFIGYVFILTIKMRKSPFDLSTSHHPHQELVKGITTEMSSRNLAVYTVTEWYENIFLLSMAALFIINDNPWSYLAAVIVVLLICFFETLIDNVCARVKWYTMVKTSWIVTILACGINLMILMLID